MVKKDGNTRLHFELWSSDFLSVTLTATINGELDWGDGTRVSCSDSEATAREHTYFVCGFYVITIIPSGNIVLNTFEATSGFPLHMLQKVEIGDSCSWSSASFFSQADGSLYLYIPERITSLPEITYATHLYFDGTTNLYMNSVFYRYGAQRYSFYGHRRLCFNNERGFYLSGTCISFGDCSIYLAAAGYAGYGVNSPQKIIIDSRQTTLPSGNYGAGTWLISGKTFYYIEFPSTLTSISVSFTLAGVLKCYATTPPTLSAAITHQGNSKILIPKGTLSAYQEATNWAASAEYMEEMDE